MATNYAYRSVEAALRAAFSPPVVHYTLGPLANWTGGERSATELSAQDRVAQAAMVRALVERLLPASDVMLLRVKYQPVTTESEAAAHHALTALVVGRLLAGVEVDRRFATDVILHDIGAEPVGSMAHDWPRWLHCSSATVYRRAGVVRAAYYSAVERALRLLRGEFSVRNVAG